MSIRKFSVGDRVRIHSPAGSYHGAETTVASGPHQSACCPSCSAELPGYDGEVYYVVDLPSKCDFHIRACQAMGPEKNLIPIYDGRETVSWEQCAWQPRTLKV